MIVAFRLNDWIMFWTNDFKVWVDEKIEGFDTLPRPIDEKLEETLELYKEKAEGDKRFQKILDRVLGPAPDFIQHSSISYWMLSAQDSLNISPSEWDALPLKQKAKRIAYMQTKNRIQTYDRLLTELNRDK